MYLVHPIECLIPNTCPVFLPCCGLLMAGTWWSGVDDEKVKGKRLIFPGLRSWHLLSRESARNRETERKKEREGERKKDTGTQVLMDQGCFIEFWRVYIPVASSYKDQETRLYKLPRKQGAIEAKRPKGDPYQKRVVNNPFHQMEKLMKEILCKHPSSLISVLGEAYLLLSPWQGLIRNRGLKRERKQQTGILKTFPGTPPNLFDF